MTIQQILQDEIQESKRWIDREKDESTYKLDLKKRVELINWTVDNMKNPDVCQIIETKMNEIIDKINKTDSIFEADPLDSELRILEEDLLIFSAQIIFKSKQNRNIILFIPSVITR